MLRSIKQLYGDKLGASDGDIGHVKDFYFDDQNWAVRYLVADTGSWLPGRQVLISPHSISSLAPDGKVLRVNLTREQIGNCPAIETHKPVSRQYEEEYHRYYGWPFYWQGDGLGGLSGFPILDLPPGPTPGVSEKTIGPRSERADAHLRSTRAVNGYHLQSGEEIIGHVCDFRVDARSWAIGELVVKTGHRLSGKEVMIPAKDVERISYETSTVFVKGSKVSIEHLTATAPAPAGAED